MSEILTHTRIMFDPIHPDRELVDIRDIAHALSLLCRANGHFPTFYSVGQHSVNCAVEAEARGYSRRVQLACLLHDASEAYLADVTRPVKKELPRYRQIEEPLQALIWEKYLGEPLSRQEEKQVFDIDDAVLWQEFVTLMDMKLSETQPVLLGELRFDFAGFTETEQAFLQRFQELTAGKNT